MIEENSCSIFKINNAAYKPFKLALWELSNNQVHAAKCMKHSITMLNTKLINYLLIFPHEKVDHLINQIGITAFAGSKLATEALS
ncbi:hypothetical protein ESZ39_07715 [Colwellia sp. C1TZA3]|nr:hypothetical protein ESZ39_07715 [Colwellia sp. C1TZA3]